MNARSFLDMIFPRPAAIGDGSARKAHVAPKRHKHPLDLAVHRNGGQPEVARFMFNGRVYDGNKWMLVASPLMKDIRYIRKTDKVEVVFPGDPNRVALARIDRVLPLLFREETRSIHRSIGVPF